MTALSVLLVGLILIVAHSAVATVRMLIHIGIFQSLITNAAKKAQEKKTTASSPWVEKDPKTLIDEAWINGYMEESARIHQAARRGSTREYVAEGLSRMARRNALEGKL